MRWEDNSDPSLPASKLENLKVIKDGKVSFEAFLSQEYMTVLGGMVVLSDGIPTEHKPGIVNTAIFTSARKGVITPKSIAKEIKRQENSYLKKPLNTFSLVSSLSISRFETLPAIRINGCSITFLPALHKKYVIERQDIERRASQWLYRKPPVNYINVVATVKSRSVEEAANRALDQIDLIRGIWNLRHTSSMRMSSGRIKPVNTVLLGPLHTIHLPSKKLATETYWYQQNYHDEVSALRLGNKKEKTLYFTKNVRKRLNGHPYRLIVEESIRRYARALDYPDLDASFLKLWSVLELLTNTLKSSYKVTIQRASFTFGETYFHRQVLNNLRSYRNASVHSGSEPTGQTESFLYQLKRYVEQLIVFHLFSGIRFSDIASAASFLDMEPDVSMLREQRKMISAAIKYRS
ncbi:hypothetical protein [Thiohalophilus sp.]|uniref:hypothetical protein n=1 Tax=Thiohalophilus sp. TaxID=3028392 RepID=UPI002ACE1DC1|nr:hypothetical protein [Thiohalophilus sp.]MDZ7660906.1 hypothetical protein [Thiohalophilus sp.]